MARILEHFEFGIGQLVHHPVLRGHGANRIKATTHDEGGGLHFRKTVKDIMFDTGRRQIVVGNHVAVFATDQGRDLGHQVGVGIIKTRRDKQINRMRGPFGPALSPRQELLQVCDDLRPKRVEPGKRSGQRHRLQALGCLERHVLGYSAAHGSSDDMGFLDPELVHQSESCVGEVSCAHRVGDQRAVTRTRVVERDHPVLVLPRGELWHPGGVITSQAVDQKYGKAFAFLDVVDVVSSGIHNRHCIAPWKYKRRAPLSGTRRLKLTILN